MKVWIVIECDSGSDCTEILGVVDSEAKATLFCSLGSCREYQEWDVT